MNRMLDLRKETGLLQKQVALELGIDRTSYVKYEKGQTQPSFEMMQRIADFYNVSIDYLLGNSDIRNHADADDEEGVYAIREELRRRPEMRTLFDAARKVSDDDLLRAVKIIEALASDK